MDGRIAAAATLGEHDLYSGRLLRGRPFRCSLGRAQIHPGPSRSSLGIHGLRQHPGGGSEMEREALGFEGDVGARDHESLITG